MKKNEIKTINVAILLLLASFVIGIGLSFYINNKTPQYSVKTLKSAKMTDLENAYTTPDDNLKALTSNRQQNEYSINEDFHFNKSGNISLYTFQSDNGNVAMSKNRYKTLLQHAQKSEHELQPLRQIRKSAFIFAAILLLVILGELLTMPETKKQD